MIARLSGTLAQKSPEALIVDVHGVGYRVLVSLTAFAALPAEGEPVTLAIHTNLRENALELFGFVAAAEQQLFGALITVSGIGPRMALNILSGVPADELTTALADGNVARLVAIPGIGKRTAERLVVELQDRVRKLALAPAASADAAGASDAEAVSALVNLGYRPAEAERAVRAVVAHGARELADVIRRALQKLSG
ncbi:MAG: Holliday junction branch migration protein RuvA [Deltaproteobacteria bacterium]|nr:Holliday junction branch migration protein RuvA [Deltaproteobacteria bacterium]